MPREFPVVAFLWQLCKHSQPWDLNSQTHSNPWLHTVVSHKGSQLWSWEVWLPARSPAALGTQAQEFTGFLPSENMELRNASCHQDIHPVANAESRGKSFQDLPQAVTCYWAAHRERRAVSCKPFYAQFIPILCIIKKWFASDAVKNKNVEYPPMPPGLWNEKSREKVKGLINLQFIFIVSRCFNLLGLGLLQSVFCSCPNTLSALTATETLLTKTSNALHRTTQLSARFILRKDCLEVEARAVQAEQQGEWVADTSSKQALKGDSSEDSGERLKWWPCPPCIH